MKRTRRHLSYANVAATLALLFAMSGGALAAKHYLVSSPKQISPKVLKSFAASNTTLFKKLAKSVPVASAESAAHATSANSATTAASATSASTAATATNALSLGGTPAAGFTHSDCGSETGQIKGYAEVPAVPPAGKFTSVPGYSCSGRAPEVEKNGEGYLVRFPGNPGKALIATVKDIEEAQFAYPIVITTGPGEFAVFMFNPTNPPKTEAVGFTALVP